MNLKILMRKIYCKLFGQYFFSGKNNKLILVKNGKHIVSTKKIKGLTFDITRNNNTIEIHYPTRFRNTCIRIGNDNVYIWLGESPFYELAIKCAYGNSQKLIIGDGTRIHGGNFILTEYSQCVVGKNCMFSNLVWIWPSDAHSILDKKTGKLLNRAKKTLIIGDHCWLAQGVRVTKNARIPNNTIVGSGSGVYKKYTEEYTIIAGNPAKVIKHNVIWQKDNPYEIECQKNLN